MKIKIIYSDQLTISRDDKNQINKVIRDTFRKAKSLVKLEPLTFFVYGNPVIEKNRIGGYTPSGSFIQIALHPRAKVTHTLMNKLSMTVAHELHHASRWNGVGFGDTFLDILLSEGMGKLFEEEVTGLKLDPLVAKFTQEEIKKFIPIAEKEFFTEIYSYSDWFFGSEKRLIPKRMGYAIGCFMVMEYMKSKNTNPSKMVNLSSRQIYATVKNSL